MKEENGHIFLHSIIVSIGLACFLCTLLAYSGALTPFHSNQYLTYFDDARVIIDMGIVALTACIISIAAVLGRILPAKIITVIGGILFIFSESIFCFTVLFGELPEWLINLSRIAFGLGCCAICLGWGRIMSHFELRNATQKISLAVLLQVVIEIGICFLPASFAVTLFEICVVITAIFPIIVLTNKGSESIAIDQSEKTDDTSRSVNVRSFLGMIAAPAIGLALFAAIMGMRGEGIIEDYPYLLIAQVIAALLVLIFSYIHSKRPLIHLVYYGLIPIAAVFSIAIIAISSVLLGGSEFEVLGVYFLYLLTAILTLSIIAGLSHAAEFSSDLICAAALLLFCIATLLGQLIDRSFTNIKIVDAIVVVTAVYAIGMVLYTILRNLRLDKNYQLLNNDFDTSLYATKESMNDIEHNRIDWTLDFEKRSDEIAERYNLTQREHEILKYLALGHNGAFISDVLLISPNTVRVHIHNIYQKLGVTSREEILRLIQQ